MNKQVNKENRYSGNPDFRILIFLNLLITRTQKSFPVLSQMLLFYPRRLTLLFFQSISVSLGG